MEINEQISQYSEEERSVRTLIYDIEFKMIFFYSGEVLLLCSKDKFMKHRTTVRLQSNALRMH